MFFPLAGNVSINLRRITSSIRREKERRGEREKKGEKERERERERERGGEREREKGKERKSESSYLFACDEKVARYGHKRGYYILIQVLGVVSTTEKDGG